MLPTVFVSYSHDNEMHKNWVLQLASRLRKNGVDVRLDLWDLKLGQDLAAFMEQGLSESNRVVCVCSKNYIDKANNGLGGVGYEKQIMTAELLKDPNQNWVVPVIKNSDDEKKVPAFLSGKLYVSFEDESSYESSYDSLLRGLLGKPVLPKPPIGDNPFETAKFFSEQKFNPNSEKYVSPALKGKVTFDYSNNNGRFSVGQDELMFELRFSKASSASIHLLNDPASIRTVAIAQDTSAIEEIEDARMYDTSSRIRNPKLNQIAVLQNSNGFYAAIKILSITDDSRGHPSDGITFEYAIQSNGSPNFTSLV